MGHGHAFDSDRGIFLYDFGLKLVLSRGIFEMGHRIAQ